MEKIKYKIYSQKGSEKPENPRSNLTLKEAREKLKNAKKKSLKVIEESLNAIKIEVKFYDKPIKLWLEREKIERHKRFLELNNHARYIDYKKNLYDKAKISDELKQKFMELNINKNEVSNLMLIIKDLQNFNSFLNPSSLNKDIKCFIEKLNYLFSLANIYQLMKLFNVSEKTISNWKKIIKKI